MDEKKAREAFGKIKEDMNSLNTEVKILKQELTKVVEILSKIIEKKEKNIQKHPNKQQKQPVWTSTQGGQKQTLSTHSSTHQHPFKPLRTQNLGISTRNEGVSTDRQTDRQTNRHTPISSGKHNFNTETGISEQPQDSIDNAVKILDSLDGIKKEIRIKFKKLTDQELLVFSTLYQLDEEDGYSDYKTLAKKLNLTESSIRDYIGRLIKKGIPVEKKRISNKYVRLKVSDNLKKIASLPTILQLRDL